MRLASGEVARFQAVGDFGQQRFGDPTAAVCITRFVHVLPGLERMLKAQETDDATSLFRIHTRLGQGPVQGTPVTLIHITGATIRGHIRIQNMVHIVRRIGAKPDAGPHGRRAGRRRRGLHRLL